MTWSSHDFPKIVTTGVSAATSSRRFGIVAGLVRPMPGRPERRELRALPAHLAGRREEVDVLGVRARPAALDERHPELVEHPRDAQLVGERQRDVLALRPVAQGRVVEDDRARRSCRDPGARRERLEHRGGEPGRADHDESIGADRRIGQVAGPPAVVERARRPRPRSRPRHPAVRATSAAASPPTGSCRSGSRCRDRRCPGRSRGSARRGRTGRARSAARRAMRTAACRGSRRAPTPRPTGCRRTGSR